MLSLVLNFMTDKLFIFLNVSKFMDAILHKVRFAVKVFLAD